MMQVAMHSENFSYKGKIYRHFIDGGSQAPNSGFSDDSGFYPGTLNNIGINPNTTSIFDAPNVGHMTPVIKFETVILITNYMGSGKNLILGSFIWGTTNYGNQLISTEVTLKSTILQTTRATLERENIPLFN